MSIVKKHSACVVIPMYNEEEVAEECIDEVMKTIVNIKDQVGFIVVNAASKDNTKQILKIKKRQYTNLHVIHLSENSGYGGALIEGTKVAKKLGYEFVIFMDSDLTNDPKDIPRFLSEINDEIDCVKASRYIKGGGTKNVPYYRQIISIVGNRFASLFFGIGIHDCTNGFRMVRISNLDNINFKERSFAIILEELYKLKKMNSDFTEIPVVLSSRTNTKSSFTYSIKIFYDYSKYFIKATLV
jgi:glycosyltransferase involved in cell wall biosynthesis